MSLPNQAQLALRPYERFICALDLEKFSFSGEQRVVPRIVHAPTGHHFKGTKHFLNAIERLRQDGVKFEFELIEGVSNQIALEKYTNADIILGQVYCPCGGKLAHEGMALGKVVLTRMGFDKGYDEKTPEGCSLVDIGPDNIYEKLKELISNASKRRELSVIGRAYFEKNNDCTLAAKRIIELLSTKEDIEPEFIPNFFRNHFVPESNEAAIVYNKWNAYLSDCHWYSKYVGTFDRNGLKF